MTIIKILVMDKNDINVSELLFESDVMQKFYKKIFLCSFQFFLLAIHTFIDLNQCLIPKFVMIFLTFIQFRVQL